MNRIFIKYELLEPVRIDKFLTNELEDASRSMVQDIIEKQQVLVNEKIIKPSYLLKHGDMIEVMMEDTVPSDIVAEDIPLDIYYEDTDLLVVNKPTGMVVHPAVGHYSNTLVNALLFHCKDLSGINGVERPGIVHRIDKDTSGLLVVCKNDVSHRDLSRQLAEKTVTRKYVAICSGVIPHNLGKIDAPLSRNPNNRQQIAVVDGGKEAVTHFKVLERFRNHTLVECVLETGRTHQIRVHMQYIGYPVLGDPIYGHKKTVSNQGQFLHAQTLGFVHPKTKEYLEFFAPLPQYFKDMIEELKK
ncbi:MAG TPA: RluA family pseudouridine synthase [Bacilli bacterium]|nr:RluA family pseudouridine synthase [Bacilli bacterium]